VLEKGLETQGALARFPIVRKGVIQKAVRRETGESRTVTEGITALILGETFFVE
jgi:hypothetical protein